MIGLGQGFRVQRFPDVIGIQGFIWFPKSILEAFYERSVGFVILNLKPGTSLAIMWQNQHLSRELSVFNFALILNPER